MADGSLPNRTWVGQRQQYVSLVVATLVSLVGVSLSPLLLENDIQNYVVMAIAGLASAILFSALLSALLRPSVGTGVVVVGLVVGVAVLNHVEVDVGGIDSFVGVRRLNGTRLRSSCFLPHRARSLITRSSGSNSNDAHVKPLIPGALT